MFDDYSLVKIPFGHKKLYIEILKHYIFQYKKPDINNLRRIYQIFAMMDLSQDERLDFLNILNNQDSVELQDEDLNKLNIKTKISLLKDLEYFHINDFKHSFQSNEIIKRLGLPQKFYQFIVDWLNWENKIMKKIGRHDLVVNKEDIPVELFKKATSLGIPLTALYLSGSVIGFSAVGITSGLTAIGNISLLVGLGLNPMAAGIVALLVLGISIKKILDALFPSTRLEKEGLIKAVHQQEDLRSRYLNFLKNDYQLLSRNFLRLFFLSFINRPKRKELSLRKMIKKVLALENKMQRVE